MSLRRSAFLAVFLVLLGASAALADTFVESFDDGTLDAKLLPHADAGYSEEIASGKLSLAKTNGSGAGEVMVRTGFAFGGDFTVSVVAARTDLGGGAKLGLRVVFQGGATAEIYLDGSDGIEGIIKDQSATQMVSASTATLRVRRAGNDVFCEYDGGSGFQAVKSRTGDVQLGKASARAEMVLVQTGNGTAAASGTLDDFTIDAAGIQGGATATPVAATPTPTPTVTPTPRPSPATLDHFFSYVVKPTKGTAAFVPLGMLTLTDAFGGRDYDVVKPVAVALPADKNGGGRHDSETHLLAYAVKPSKGASKFAPQVDVHLLNQCSDVFLTLKKPVSLLVPTAKSLAGPVDAPLEASHQLDHFLCYQAKPQTKLANGSALPKLAKGTQADVVDQFQTRRYDLKTITKLCVPTDKSGTPIFLKGPAQGTTATITPSTRRHADSLLVCYQAKLATADIPQAGCGALDPKSKGTKIDPKQPKHTPRSTFVSNQLGPLRLDSAKELELCVPSVRL